MCSTSTFLTPQLVLCVSSLYTNISLKKHLELLAGGAVWGARQPEHGLKIHSRSWLLCKCDVIPKTGARTDKACSFHVCKPAAVSEQPNSKAVCADQMPQKVYVV